MTLGARKTSVELKYALMFFIITRLLLTIVGTSAIDFRGTLRPHEFFPVQCINQWGQWDSAWYVDIARDGYSTAIKPDGTATYGFFPLYPMLMRVAGFFTAGSPFIAGLIISNCCLIASAVFLYKLMRMDSCDEETSLRAIKYLFAFPSAFLLSAVFTESLFLFLTLATIWSAKKEKWLLCGFLGMLASLTKPYGFLLILPVAWEYIVRYKQLKMSAVWMLLIPFGTFIFAVFCLWLTGDFFAYSHITRSGWASSFKNPLSQMLFDIWYANYWHAFVPLISISTLLIFRKKINFSYFLFGTVLVLFQLSFTSGNIAAVWRHQTAMFPLFIIFAKISHNKTVDDILTIVFWIVQTFLMIFWVTGTRIII